MCSSRCLLCLCFQNSVSSEKNHGKLLSGQSSEKKRRKAKEKEPMQRRCLMHVVNVKEKVSTFTDCSGLVIVYLIDQFDAFGMDAALE